MQSQLADKMENRWSKASSINAEQETKEAVVKVQQEGRATRGRLRAEHKIRMAQSRAMCVNATAEGVMVNGVVEGREVSSLVRSTWINSSNEPVMINEEMEDYADKIEDFHMDQQARIAAVTMLIVRREANESDKLSEAARNCGVIHCLIMTEIMVIKGLIDAAEVPLSDKQKMMEVIDINDDVWLRGWPNDNIPRNVEEFKTRTRITKYEERWLDQLREINGSGALSQLEKMNPEKIPDAEIMQVIDASPLVERAGKIISESSDTEARNERLAREDHYFRTTRFFNGPEVINDADTEAARDHATS